MSDEQQKEKRPLSMTRRYRRGLILTGVLCVLAMLAAATVLFQRSYTDRVDDYLAQLGGSYAAAYKAQPTHDAKTLVSLLPKPGVDAPRFTLINGDGTVLFDSKTSALVYDAANTVYAVMDSHLPSHADRPEFQQAMADGTASVTRESETVRRETHYYAVRIDTPDGAQVLRVGEDIASIWGLSTDTLPLLCAAMVLILAAATLFSWWLTRRMVQPINHLAEHLDTIEADVPYQELIPLARTIQTDRKLREDNETMRREFTANVSHELKTPLTSISGYAELIETGMAKPADVPTFAARIHKEAQRMIALVSDILQLSELDSTQASQSREKPVEMAPVDLAALLKETAQNMTVNARKAYVTLQYSAQPATVQGSKDLLAELATNLCDNAIRYNQPGGHVELGESMLASVIREMREETGLLIEHPVLCGIKDWMREDGTRFIVALYRADRFTGELNSSEEGRMFWIEREEFAKTNIIWGMKDVLRVCDEAEYSEMFYSEEKESWVLLG